MIQMPALFIAFALIAASDAEAPGIQGYGARDPVCLEWSDGCVVCRHGENAASVCSTPGIACHPHDIQCDEHSPSVTK